MILKEAIERNEHIQMEFLPLPRHRDWEAVQLGIEALKAILTYRKSPMAYLYLPLPGETKE